MAVFLYEILLVQPWNCEPGPSHTVWPSKFGLALGLSAFAYSFGGHGLYPEQIREMAEPSRWGEVMTAVYAVCTPLYLLAGLLGYYAYGDAAMANINVNFPRNAANAASIAVQCVQEVFFVLESNLVVLLALELRLGLDPTSCCAPYWRGLPPWLARLVLRALFLSSQVLCAQAMLCGSGDTLFALQSLIGAVGMVAFTYVLPYVFYAVLSREPHSQRWKAWAATNICIGVLVMVAGFGSSLVELFACDQGLFAGTCKLAYTYAPDAPGDPCNASGLPPWAT
eukprot:CAMPEP_0115829824 /NCGR_PEP_ID=MMETSP0287-20121206/1298_1 /TAXON_ID=412157 /ORGANISM="Chrysochromulina rotalis, Strain UIO044" /LENGTH=281 /DNA_ID=CAMNT_0003283103 /DNA_START=84 /DNA_END=929 /DNA_ORIENTATION=-